MERLAPILKQKFWILLGVVILMTLIGWWMATSTMLKAFTDRKAEIDKAFDKVPKGTIPSADWAKKLNDLNANQEKAIGLTQAILWQKQLKRMMVWPEGVDIQNGYWGEISKESREQYRLHYKSPDSDVRKVWKMLRPLDPDDSEGSGIVNYPFSNMYVLLKRPIWQHVGAVSSDALWQVQEDLWLLERLFQAIATVNGGMESNRNDAYIHQIDQLELRGGGIKKGAKAAAPGAAALGKGKGGPEIPVAVEQVATGPAGPLTPLSAEFDPVEEFGEDGSSAGGPGTAGAPGFGKGAGSDKAPAAPKAPNRYILKDDKLPFKTRGFYLSIKMDHTKLPALIAELTANGKSVLPVEVVRVQMARLHDDTPIAPGGSQPYQPSQVAGGLGGFGGGGGGFGREARKAMKDDFGSGGLGGNSDYNVAPAAAAPKSGEVPKNMQANLAKALSDPVMAQVTICGVFTLYTKSSVEAPPEPTPAPAGSTTTDELAQPESTDQPAADGDSPPGESAKDADMPAEASDETSGVPDSPGVPDPPPKTDSEEK